MRFDSGWMLAIDFGIDVFGPAALWRRAPGGLVAGHMKLDSGTLETVAT